MPLFASYAEWKPKNCPSNLIVEIEVFVHLDPGFCGLGDDKSNLVVENSRARLRGLVSHVPFGDLDWKASSATCRYYPF